MRMSQQLVHEAGGMLAAYVIVGLSLSLLVPRVGGEYEWSGFTNTLGGTLDYTCPDNLVVVGLASDFSIAVSDRQWEFQCASGGGLANVSVTCTLQATINSLNGDITYNCPNNGYIAGFTSEFTAARTDRTWRPYCCTRPYATLISCQTPTATWENVLQGNLNYSAPRDYVVAGVQSFYFNRDRRWRFRACQVEVSCGDPGTPANAQRDGDRFLYRDQVVFTCDHGYYQSSGPEGGVRTCMETGLWSDTQPTCALCTEISHCADIRCTNASDHTCSMCESDNGPGRGEAAYRNLITECQPLCSWLDAFCYPGVCPGDSASCNCSEGFQGPDCLNITVSPVLESCSLVLRGLDGSELPSPCLIPTNTSTPPPTFTNIAPSELEATWSASYVDLASPPPPPAYVAGYSVGVATSEIRATVFRAANPTQPVTRTTHDCGGPSPDTPITGLSMCSALATPTNLSTHTFLHGDTFEVQVYVTNGGYLDVMDQDTREARRYYYSGTPTIGTALFVIDLEPPTHCSLVAPGTCLTNQAILRLASNGIVSSGVVSSGTVTAAWGGWEDIPAGIVSYEVDMFELVEMDNILYEGRRINFMGFQHTGQINYEHVAALRGEGPYSFVLQTQDQAGNTRYARQLLLYDATSTLNIDPSAPLQVISAVSDTGFMWQNSTMYPLVVSGRGHFYNTILQRNNYLAPVANYSAEIAPEFDHPLDSGQYPRRGTVNALGVTQLLYRVIVDQQGGMSTASTTQPTAFPTQSSDIGINNVEITVDVRDGDSVRVWFQVFDFNSRVQYDSVLVHIDSSPPAVQDLWLEYSGVTGLALHGTESLLDLNIQFQARDEHSGISRVEWWIGTEPGARDVGYGDVPVENVTEAACIPPACLCDSLSHCHTIQHTFSPLSSHFASSHKALHDTDYYITVFVTNHALLSSSLSHNITIDTTPPLTGAVFDGPQGSGDLDFQQELTIHAWWSGFFDRETDVAFYQYVFDTSCANSSHFSIPLEAGVRTVQTTGTNATWVAPSTGTYYATVVAYNRAHRSSPPVCSDGVTIDVTPPTLRIPLASIQAGLAMDADGNVWFIDTSGERWEIAQPTEECLNRSALIEDLSPYPIRMDGSTPVTSDPTLCSLYNPFAPTLLFLTTSHLLNVTWIASDDIGIRDFEFGITNAENYSGDPSTITYLSTGGHTHYSVFDPELIQNGNRLIISVVAVDLALHRTTVTVGPIVVDTTSPLVNGSLVVERYGSHVTVTWDEGTFVDAEGDQPLSEFEYAIGCSEYGNQVQPFQPLPPSPPLPCTTPYCIAIATTTTPLLSGHQYYFTVKVRNSAGLSTYLSSPPYTHASSPPSPGVVFDINPNSNFDIVSTGLSLHNEDIDILVDSQQLAASWMGFEHAHLDVTFSVGLGTQPGVDDVVSFTPASGGRYTFNNVRLAHGSQYFATVIAETVTGRTNASSNGVLLLLNIERGVLPYTTVYDGGTDIDTDYQLSTTFVSAHWFFLPAITQHVSHYQWAVLLAVGGNSSNLVEVRPYENVGRQTLAAAGSLELTAGERYVSAVQACYPAFCLPPVYSDGIQIATHPASTHVNATYTPLEWNMDTGTSSLGVLQINWEPFTDPQMAYYEWSLGTGEPGYELLIYWNRVELFETQVLVTINETVSLHTRNTVSLRGYNTAGLHSTASSPLFWDVDGDVLPQDSVPSSPLVVLDILESQVPTLLVTDWRQLEHREEDMRDIEYSNSTFSVSAAWPLLRYKRYNYSVSATPSFLPCGSPTSLACGSTIANAVTVGNLRLTDGRRYFVCVQAIREDAIQQTSSTPAVLTACSNGVTVDLTPPAGSCVQIVPPRLDESVAIGSGGEPSSLGPLQPAPLECVTNGSRFQASTSEIHIIWNPFLDVEQNGSAVHATGVAYYEYAIGTSPQTVDVVGFTSVGVATEAIARGLTLQLAHTYYATIRAYDFVGQWSDAVSNGVTVDTSPPIVAPPWVEGTADHTHSLGLRLDLVEECESEVVTLEWGLGSRPGSSDVLEWRVARTEEISGTTSVVERQDGQLVFLSVKAQNGAFLSSLTSSPGYILDSSPPLVGTVYDGPDPAGEDVLDMDYTTSPSELRAHWRGFTDPHTGITEYHWAIGTCARCRDVQGFQNVGTATEAARNGLTLTNGKQYYITVRGCNSVGLCAEASSNGITVDVTPPIAGRVWDGVSGPDVQFQASRTLITAHWDRFHDSQSSLQHYTYYVGLRPNDSSIIPPTPLPPSTSSLLLPSPFQLPTNRTVYTTIVAYNRAGLYTTVSSDGAYIDDTPPRAFGPVYIDRQWAGSVTMATQYSSSVIRIAWDFSDTLTAVNQYFWNLISREGVHMPLPVKTTGFQDYATCVDVQLEDGESYTALVTACNTAGTCFQQTSNPILVDSSPPIDGYFAVQTASAAEIDRTIPGGMTWRNRPVRGYAQLNLAFLGFSDPHSGIAEYWVAVGSGYSQSDLTSGAVLLQSSLASDIGTYLALVELTRLLDIQEVIYVSIWAVNGAGLKSHIVQGSFTVDPIPGRTINGSLTLLRSSTCVFESCLGHCACAARGQLCSTAPSALSCQVLDASSLPASMQLNVHNVVAQVIPGADSSRLFTSVTDKIEGRWEQEESGSTAFQRLEWSVGEKGFTPGAGLIDRDSGILWRDAGTDYSAVFTVSPSYPLQHGVTYVFHVRAWYSNSTYAVFSSEGVTIDTAGPEVWRGQRVREVSVEFGNQVDIDFVSSASQVTISWDGVFILSLSGNHSAFEIGLGDTPGTDNILAFSSVSSGLTTMSLTALSLQHRRRYYSVVRAISPLGITTTSISDGFVVDLTPPNVGVVVDGLRYHDVRAQSNVSMYSARWFGFNDPESGIHHFELAVTPSNTPPMGSSYTDMGITLKATLNGLNLTPGQTYYAHVVAVNVAGLRSADVVSSGVVVDTTRPTGIQCTTYSAEVLMNPSFEGVAGHSSPCNGLITDSTALQGWSLDASYMAVLPSSTAFSPYGGCFSLYFVGAISQTFMTTPAHFYTLSFALKRHVHMSSEYTAVFQAKLTAPGVQRVITLSTLQGNNGTVADGWQRFEVVFEAVDSISEVLLNTLNDQYGLIVDSFSVQECTAASDLVSSETIVQWSGVVSVSQEYISRAAAHIYANWNIRDSESGVREYLWAIGTVAGGEQLQRYTSTGNIRYGVSDVLHLIHGTRVFISVLAWNYVDLERVVYSDAYVVDLTPPDVEGAVLDGLGGQDVEYQSATVVSASWEGIVDPESGISECRWGLGTARGLTNIQSYTVSSSSSGTTSDLSGTLVHGIRVYATVICTNKAGLYTTAYSDGATILTDPPLHNSAYGDISSPALTTYEPLDGFIPTDDLIFTWDGFIETAGSPLTYEVRVTESGIPQEWNDVGFAKTLILSGLQLPEDVPHTLEVRTVNLAGVASQSLAVNITIVSTPPVDSGTTITYTWTSGNTLRLEWTGKFSSTAPLYYEFSLGTQMGSGSITQWLETDQTFASLTSARLNQDRDYFVTLTAVSSSGLYTTAYRMIAGMPVG